VLGLPLGLQLELLSSLLLFSRWFFYYRAEIHCMVKLFSVKRAIKQPLLICLVVWPRRVVASASSSACMATSLATAEARLMLVGIDSGFGCGCGYGFGARVDCLQSLILVGFGVGYDAAGGCRVELASFCPSQIAFGGFFPPLFYVVLI